MGNLYINIDKDYFDKTKEQANIKCREGDLNSKDYLYDIDFRLNTTELENGKLWVCGYTDLGTVSLEFDLDMDIAIDVIEFYMKKLGKLKTILEASK